MIESIETAVTGVDVLASVLEDCAPLLVAHAPEAEATRADLLRQHRQQRCEILVFGAYNAGKSTLINALLGVEVAAVRDIPTTATIDRYDFGPCVLVDTPGVNAPIEHEETTGKALSTAHLVMFVVREGDQDVADVYDRLFEMLARGSAVLLVLNHSRTRAEEVEPLRMRMLQLLDGWSRRHGHGPELLERLPVVPVNARLGLRGRTEGKPGFVATSGIEDLGIRISSWLRDVDAEAVWQQRLARRCLSELIVPLRNRLDGKLGSAAALGRVDEELMALNGRIDLIEAGLRTLARARVQRSKADIGRLLDESAGKPEQIEAGLQQIAEAGLKELVAQLTREMQALGEALAFSHRQVSISPPDLKRLLEGGSGVLGHIEAALAQVSASTLKQAKPEHLVEIMKWLRSMKFPIFKGKWERTFAKWAGRAAPWIQVAAGFIEYYGDMRAQNRHNAEQRSAALQRMQIIGDLAMAVEAAQHEFIDTQVGELRNQLLARLREERARLGAEHGELATQLERVRGWETDLRRMAGHG